MRIKSLVAALAVSCCSLLAQATDLRAGVDYEVLATPQPAAKGKVEVIEFFSYNCPHCAEFDPMLEDWVTKLPKYVSFKRVPVAFRDDWVPAAKLFLAIDNLKLPAKDAARAHRAAFAAVQSNSVDFGNSEAAANWAAQNGLNRAKFAEAFTSFGMQMRVQNASVMARNYAINGVPTLIVQGKYRARGADHEELLNNARRLVDKARGEAR